MGRSAALIERFMAKVSPEPNSGCWLWDGAHNRQGYGHFMVRGRVEKAHRVSYLLFRGAIGEIDGADYRGTCVIHSCDNPACVNPRHLRLGTHCDNMRDKKERRRVVSNPLLGERHQNSKLTAAHVLRIRELAAAGLSARQIAPDVGVHRATVSDVIRGRTWSHLTQEHRQ